MDMDAMKKMMAESSEADRKKGMEEWGTWMKENAAGFADIGGPIGKNSEVSAGGAVEKSNDVAGYSVVGAESKEAAIAFIQGSPHFKMPGATADHAEVVNMGM